MVFNETTRDKNMKDNTNLLVGHDFGEHPIHQFHSEKLIKPIYNYFLNILNKVITLCDLEFYSRFV